jgi:VWFA-related protein
MTRWMRFLYPLIPGALFAVTLAAQTPAAPVTVVDGLGRSVNDLDPNALHLYEDKAEQKVTLSRIGDQPISVGIVIDSSASMSGKLGVVEQAVKAFFRTAATRPGDEAFLIELSDRPSVTQGFTHDLQSVQDRITASEAKGKTALFDGIYLALTEMKKAANSRKVLLVISDGFDNSSRYNEAEIAGLIRESGVQIDAASLMERRDRDETGANTLRRLAVPSGGLSFAASQQDAEDVATKFGIELSQQYVVTWNPTNRAHDGKFHQITVKLTSPRGEGQFQAFVKSGYYALGR